MLLLILTSVFLFSLHMSVAAVEDALCLPNFLVSVVACFVDENALEVHQLVIAHSQLKRPSKREKHVFKCN